MAFVNSNISMQMVRRTDRNGEEFYIATPDIPAEIDLSKVAIFVFIDKEKETYRLLIQAALPGQAGPDLLKKKVEQDQAAREESKR